MKIERPEIHHQDGKVIISVPVKSSSTTDILWFSMDEIFAGHITEASDAYLVALLLPAMVKGEDIQIAGKISEKLFNNLAGPYQLLVQNIFPTLHRVNLFPESTHHSSNPARSVLAGFTGGIDSFDVLAGHYYADSVPEGFRVTHLLYHDVGSHDSLKIDENESQGWHSKAGKAAKRVGLPFIVVDSNTDSFYPPELGYVKTYSHRNAIVPLLLQAGFGRSLIASSYQYEAGDERTQAKMPYREPILFPMLSTEIHEITSVGSEHTRVEKTLRVAEIPDSYDTLYVCYRLHLQQNCSVCSKCVRTLLTMEIAGLLDRYAPTFDLDAYKRERNKKTIHRLVQRDPFYNEILAFAHQQGYPLPLYIKFSAFIINKIASFRRTKKRTPAM